MSPGISSSNFRRRNSVGFTLLLHFRRHASSKIILPILSAKLVPPFPGNTELPLPIPTSLSFIHFLFHSVPVHPTTPVHRRCRRCRHWLLPAEARSPNSFGRLSSVSCPM